MEQHSENHVFVHQDYIKIAHVKSNLYFSLSFFFDFLNLVFFMHGNLWKNKKNNLANYYNVILELISRKYTKYNVVFKS